MTTPHDGQSGAAGGGCPRPTRTVAPLIVTAVLVCLGGLAVALSALSDPDVLTRGYSTGFVELYFVRPQDWLREYYWSAVVAGPSAAILLVGGAVLFVVRRRWGQVVLTAGCAVVIALGIFGAAVQPDLLNAGLSAPLDRVRYLAPLLFPIAVVVLAWWPSSSGSPSV